MGTRSRCGRLAAAVLLALGALGGCAGPGAGAPLTGVAAVENEASNRRVAPPTTKPSAFTAEQAGTIASSTANEIADSAGTLTFGELAAARTVLSTTPGCLAIVPVGPTDTSHNIPEDVWYVFRDCTATVGGVTGTYDGIIKVLDVSTPATTALNQTVSATFSAGDGRSSYTETRNGQRFPSLAGNQLSELRNMTVSRSTALGTATITHSWTWQFVPSAGTVSMNQRLPAGVFTQAGGSLTWVRNNENFTLTVSIASPLVYDPACSSHPRITAGAVRYVRTGSSTSASFTQTFNGCGRASTVSLN